MNPFMAIAWFVAFFFVGFMLTCGLGNVSTLVGIFVTTGLANVVDVEPLETRSGQIPLADRHSS